MSRQTQIMIGEKGVAYAKRKAKATRTGTAWVWTHIRCSECGSTQEASGEAWCAECGAEFEGEVRADGLSAPDEGAAAGAQEPPTPQRTAEHAAAIRAAAELVKQQTTKGSTAGSARVWAELVKYAATMGIDPKQATDEDVCAFLHHAAENGRTVQHEEACPRWGAPALHKDCGVGCKKAAAPSSLWTKAKLLSIAFNAEKRTGPYTGSSLQNNPVQSTRVKAFLRRYEQAVAQKGFEAAPRDIILTRTLSAALMKCIALIQEAQVAWKGADVGSAERARAAYTWALWAQMGAVCSAAHSRGQRAESMAQIRTRSVACWTEEGGARTLFLNALLTKTRRTGKKSTMVIRERRATEEHICAVWWYDQYSAALKRANVYDDFEYGSFFFCKIWQERTTGGVQRRIDPMKKGVVQTWSSRLKRLLKGVDTGNQVIGMAGLRGGGAVAQRLTGGRDRKAVMKAAEWKNVRTFRHYTQLHAVFEGAAPGPSEASAKSLADLVQGRTEQEYEAMDQLPMKATPFKDGGGKGPK